MDKWTAVGSVSMHERRRETAGTLYLSPVSRGFDVRCSMIDDRRLRLRLGKVSIGEAGEEDPGRSGHSPATCAPQALLSKGEPYAATLLSYQIGLKWFV